MDFGGGPMGSEPMPPMGEDPMADGEPMADMDQGGEGEELETDPKKEIQKLTGELSQKLRLYNDENNDAELSKYVAGMIATQAGKNMNANDKKDIVKKMNGAEEEMEDMADEGGQPTEGGQQAEPQMECRKLNSRISETFNSMIYDERKKKRPSKEVKNGGVTSNNPFIYK